MPDPVQDVPIATALSVTLNNYYDLLKAQVGGLNADEFIQLKLVADPVDISSKDYTFHSFLGLTKLSDTAIIPSPTDNSVSASALTLESVYGDFLRDLRNVVGDGVLTDAETQQIAELQQQIDYERGQIDLMETADWVAWQKWAPMNGFQVTDRVAYANWAKDRGHLDEIQNAINIMSKAYVDQKKLWDRQYADPDDQQVIDAVKAFDSPAMLMALPYLADNLYSPALTLQYLASIALSSGGVGTGLFDVRRAFAWGPTLSFLETSNAGSFNAQMTRQTTSSNSISTDWGASASVSYFFISAHASLSDSKQIQEEFTKLQTVTLQSQAALKVDIVYPQWFNPGLFSHKRVFENPKIFAKYFGAQGTLLYYPTHLILVRGFRVDFVSSQNWVYDYHDHFSASSGGGLNIFGINFGGSQNYTNDTKEHKVDTAGTTLTVKDDDSTIRFVGYAVHKNTQLQDSFLKAQREALAPFVKMLEETSK